MKGKLLVTLMLAVFFAGVVACSDNPVNVDVPKDSIKVQAEPAQVTIDAPAPQTTNVYEGSNDDNSVNYPDGAFNPAKTNDPVLNEDGSYKTFNPLGAIQGAVVDAYDGFLIDGVDVYLYNAAEGQVISDKTEHGIWGFAGVYTNARYIVENGDLVPDCHGSCTSKYVLTMDLRANTAGRKYRDFSNTTVSVYWDTVGDGTSLYGSDPNTDTLIGYLVSGGHTLEVRQLRGSIGGSVHIDEDLGTSAVSGLQFVVYQAKYNSSGSIDGRGRAVDVVTVQPDGTWSTTEGKLEEDRHYTIDILNKDQFEFDPGAAKDSDSVWDTTNPSSADAYVYVVPGTGNGGAEGGIKTVTKPVIVKKIKVEDKIPPYIVSTYPNDGSQLQLSAFTNEIVFNTNEDLYVYDLEALIKYDGSIPEFYMVNLNKSNTADLDQPYRNFKVVCDGCTVDERGATVGRKIKLELLDLDFFMDGYSYRVTIDSDNWKDKFNNARSDRNDLDDVDALERVKKGKVFPAGDLDDTLFFSFLAPDEVVDLAGLRVMPKTLDGGALAKLPLESYPDDADYKEFEIKCGYGFFDHVGAFGTKNCGNFDQNVFHVSWAPVSGVILYEFFTTPSSDSDQFLMVKEGGDGDPVVQDKMLADGASIKIADVIDTLNKANLISPDSTSFGASMVENGQTWNLCARAVNVQGVPGALTCLYDIGDNVAPRVAIDKGDAYAIRYDWKDGKVAADNKDATDYFVEFPADGNKVGDFNVHFSRGLDSEDNFGDADFVVKNYGQAIMLLQLTEPVLVTAIQDANTVIKGAATKPLITGEPRITNDDDARNNRPIAPKDDVDARVIMVAPVMKNVDDYARDVAIPPYLADAVAVMVDQIYKLNSGDQLDLKDLGLEDQAGNVGDGKITLTVNTAPVIKRVKVWKDATAAYINVWMSRRTACFNAAGELIDGFDATNNLCDNDYTKDAPFIIDRQATAWLKKNDGGAVTKGFTATNADPKKAIWFNEVKISNLATGESLYTIKFNQAELISEGDVIKVRDNKIYGFDHLGRLIAATGDRYPKVLTDDNGKALYYCGKDGDDTLAGIVCGSDKPNAKKLFWGELTGIKGAYLLTGANENTALFGGLNGAALPATAGDVAKEIEWNGEFILDEFDPSYLKFHAGYQPEFKAAQAGAVQMNGGYPFNIPGANIGDRDIDHGNIFAVRVNRDAAPETWITDGYIEICLTDDVRDLDDLDQTSLLALEQLKVKKNDDGGDCVASDQALCQQAADEMGVGGYLNIALTFDHVGFYNTGGGAPDFTTLFNDFRDRIPAASCGANIDDEDCHSWLFESYNSATLRDAARISTDDPLSQSGLVVRTDDGASRAAGNAHNEDCYKFKNYDKCAGKCDMLGNKCWGDDIDIVQNACGVGHPGAPEDTNAALPALRIPFKLITAYKDNAEDDLGEAGCKNGIAGFAKPTVATKYGEDADNNNWCFYTPNTVTFAVDVKHKDGRVIIPANSVFEFQKGAAKASKNADITWDDGGTERPTWQYYWKKN